MGDIKVKCSNCKHEFRMKEYEDDMPKMWESGYRA